MKKMICNKEKNAIVTAVSSRATMMTLVTMISSREMITVSTIAGTHDTIVTISRNE